MAKRRGFGIAPIAFGFGLYWLAKSIELQGDLRTAPGDRLTYHGLALLFLLAALGCFVWGVWRAARFLFKGPATPEADLVKVFAANDADDGSRFDADAALARYFERKQAGEAPPEAPPLARATFGRKQA